MDIHDIILASRAELSYSTRARWALRAIRKYLRLGLAPSWRYKILHARARAIFSTALKAAVISIYIHQRAIFCLESSRSPRTIQPANLQPAHNTAREQTTLNVTSNNTRIQPGALSLSNTARYTNIQCTTNKSSHALQKKWTTCLPHDTPQADNWLLLNTWHSHVRVVTMVTNGDRVWERDCISLMYNRWCNCN